MLSTLISGLTDSLTSLTTTASDAVDSVLNDYSNYTHAHIRIAVGIRTRRPARLFD